LNFNGHELSKLPCAIDSCKNPVYEVPATATIRKSQLFASTLSKNGYILAVVLNLTYPLA